MKPEEVRKRWEDEPLPKMVYCCSHKPSCAVHQPPDDGRNTDCTCDDEWRGPYIRHRYSPRDPRLSDETTTTDH